MSDFLRKKNPVLKLPVAGRSQLNSCKIWVYRYANPAVKGLIQLDASDKNGIFGGTVDGADFSTNTIIKIDNDVISCDVSKTKSDPAGSFTFTLKQGRSERGELIATGNPLNYANLINVGDWVTIWMKKGLPADIPGDTSANSGLKMIGFIEDVTVVERDDPATGIPYLEYVISGSDIGKVFLTNLYFNPILKNAQLASLLGTYFMGDSQKLTDYAKKNGRGDNGLSTPDKMVTSIATFMLGGNLDKLSASHQNWYIPKELLTVVKGAPQKNQPAVIDILDVVTKVGVHSYDSRGSFVSASPLLGETIFPTLPSQGTIWEVMTFVQNPCLNEMYVDLTLKDEVVNGKRVTKLVPTLVCRQLPFSSKTQSETYAFRASKIKDAAADIQKTFFVDLPRQQIESLSIKEKSITKTNRDRVNQIVVSPEVVNQEVGALYVSLLNVPSIKRYGLKSFEFRTNYTFSESFQDTKIVKVTAALLADWLFKGHMLYKGRIRIDGPNTYFSVGTNLEITDQNQLFHIEGVDYSFRQMSNGMNSYEAVVQVSHGVSSTGSFLSFDDLGAFGSTIVTGAFENTKNSRGKGGYGGNSDQ
jgi:hypothetical protein